MFVASQSFVQNGEISGASFLPWPKAMLNVETEACMESYIVYIPGFHDYHSSRVFPCRRSVRLKKKNPSNRTSKLDEENKIGGTE